MNRLILLLAVLLTASNAANAQIAITEMFINPNTLSDDDGEFVELFNYSNNTINLNGWSLDDEETSDPIVFIQSDYLFLPGTYVVLAKNKVALETAFFGGISQPGIIDFGSLVIANSGDEILLLNPADEIVWSIAYPNGESNGNAAFLSEDNFSVSVWGSKLEPGIDFTDIDSASGTLGYQNNNTTPDPNAITVETDTASPLAGFYTIGGSGGSTTDPDFVIQVISPGQAPNTYEITFSSQQGSNYTLESSPDLTEESFTSITPVIGTGNSTSVTAPATGARQFFRIRRDGGVVINP